MCLSIARQARADGQAKPDAKRIEHGHYIAQTHGCGDCHTPWKMGANGPVPDSTRLFAGHPQELMMPPAPAPQGPWMISAAATFTSWAGPWGVSFSKNLTPDKDTGLGSWTEENFIQTIRTGREMGKGRMILPPMPIPSYSHMTDADLKDLWAYLMSIPPIQNKVPGPIAPPAPPGSAK